MDKLLFLRAYTEKDKDCNYRKEQFYIIRSMKAIQVLVFLVVTIVIAEIIFRYLLPSREKRGYVLVFYSLATACSLLCITEGFYFTLNPD